MATTKVGIAPMKVAQVHKAGADFEIVDREIPRPGAGEVRIKVQACGVCGSDVLTKEGSCPEFSIHAFRDTKSPASSIKWAPVFPSGRRDSASVSAGMAAKTARVPRVGAEIFAIAAI
jgi:hypothetical protein